MSRGTGQGFKLHHGAGMWWRFSGYLEQIFGKLGFHGGNISGREERGSYKTLARGSGNLLIGEREKRQPIREGLQ